MEFKIISYPNKSTLKPVFYIQIKGLHSGRPMKQPIVNCVAVYTDIPNLFEVVYALWKGRYFECDIIGSVIPFIRIDAIKKVINTGMRNYKGEKLTVLAQVGKVDEMVANGRERIKALQTLQIALCRAYFK